MISCAGMDAGSSLGAAEQPETSNNEVRSQLLSNLLRLQLQPEHEPIVSRCSLQSEWCLVFFDLTELMCPIQVLCPQHSRIQPQKHKNCSPGRETATHLSKADQVFDAAADQERCAGIQAGRDFVHEKSSGGAHNDLACTAMHRLLEQVLPIWQHCLLKCAADH